MRDEPLRSNDIRQRNEKLILNLIHVHEKISQSEVVAATGLKAPTVFRIFTDLEKKSLIRPLGRNERVPSRKGRKPVSYGLEPAAKYAVGVDFFPGSASIAVLDIAGSPVHQETLTFSKDMDADRVTHTLVRLVRDSVKKVGIPWKKILGVGVGSPGVVDLRRGRILHSSGIQGMHDYDIGHRMEQELKVPVHLQNNTSLTALSEYRYGKVRGAMSLLLILIRAGVGGSFIHDGKLFVNQDRSAFEIGHLSLDRNGRPCVCGARGCLETYLSEDAIVSDLQQCSNILTLADVERALLAEERAVQDNLSQKAEMLAQGIRNLSVILSPEVCLVVTRSRPLSEFLTHKAKGFIDEMNRHVRSSEHGIDVEILADQYDPLLVGRGACDLVFDRFFQVDAQV